MDLAERAKYKHKGETRDLTDREKVEFVRREMRNLRFDSDTFYEYNPMWYAFETRMRDLTLAIVEPII